MIHNTCEELFMQLIDRDSNQHLAVYKDAVLKLLPDVERVFDEGSIEYRADEIKRVIDLRSSLDGMVSKDDFCDGITALAAGVRSISLQELDSSIKSVEKQVKEVTKKLEDTCSR